MFVRTLYVTGDPGLLDGAVDRLTADRDFLTGQPGFRGFGLFKDGELGKLLGVTWWEGEQARRDSDEQLRDRRRALLEPFAATVAAADYEAAVFHRIRRPGAGAAMRLSRLEIAPEDVDLLVETFRSTTLPRLETLDGLIGTTLFVDRERGRGTVGVMFADRGALAASRSGQAAARGESAAKAHVTVTGLEEFDVVFADVRTD
ncbi:hypothetical protein [Kitasatospora sp. NPDC057015]|uniref:hypothetical protein n=1 Tax=Kitasatospora sp. NPDC057015 TaxID=3346001 RepID=UPI003639DE98